MSDDAETWRERARELRTMAANAKDSETKRLMLELAAAYVFLATHAEDAAKGKE